MRASPMFAAIQTFSFFFFLFFFFKSCDVSCVVSRIARAPTVPFSSLSLTSFKENAALLCTDSRRQRRTVPPVPHELMLTLGYRHLQPLDRSHRHVRVSVAQVALLLRHPWDTVADHGVAAHPVVHGVAH